MQRSLTDGLESIDALRLQDRELKVPLGDPDSVHAQQTIDSALAEVSDLEHRRRTLGRNAH